MTVLILEETAFQNLFSLLNSAVPEFQAVKKNGQKFCCIYLFREKTMSTSQSWNLLTCTFNRM